MSKFQMINVNIAVMDYSNCKIKIYTAQLLSDYQCSDVEDWLYNNTDYDDGNCYYMCNSNGIEVEYV